jgi:hypothetical protein
MGGIGLVRQLGSAFQTACSCPSDVAAGRTLLEMLPAVPVEWSCSADMLLMTARFPGTCMLLVVVAPADTMLHLACVRPTCCMCAQ